jgi:hypothetical protein
MAILADLPRSRFCFANPALTEFFRPFISEDYRSEQSLFRSQQACCRGNNHLPKKFPQIKIVLRVIDKDLAPLPAEPMPASVRGITVWIFLNCCFCARQKGSVANNSGSE